MDCFAEPVITVRAQLRSSRGGHSRDPLARNDVAPTEHDLSFP
jgi:hypothetical protein